MWVMDTKPGSRICEMSYCIYLDVILCRTIAMSTSITILRGISGKKQCMHRILYSRFALFAIFVLFTLLQRENGPARPPEPIQKPHQPERVSTGELPLRSWKASGRAMQCIKKPLRCTDTVSPNDRHQFIRESNMAFTTALQTPVFAAGNIE